MGNRYVIDGKEYTEVDRTAEVGDKVIGVLTGTYYEVAEVDNHGNINPKNGNFVYRHNYKTLDKVSEASCGKQPPDVTDLLANLARRVTSLESQLRDTQRNLETFAEQTERNTVDIAMLDNRTYSLTTVQSAEGILNEIERLLKRRSVCQ
jgi:hypothetical protein